tara:strand:- start:508 stop:720 length:213 start_codon:yes stop_codon:yes gene_type:complete
LEHQESFLRVALGMLGEEHWLSVVAMRDMGSIYNAAQAAGEAEAFYLRSVGSLSGAYQHRSTAQFVGHST